MHLKTRPMCMSSIPALLRIMPIKNAGTWCGASSANRRKAWWSSPAAMHSLKPKEIAAIPGVDLVLGAAEKFNIVQHVKELSKGDSAKICSCDIDEVTGFNASFSVNDRTRTFLKVQDGCNYNCSFCTIPMARGKSRSDTVANVVNTAAELAAKGVKEIILTGVNLGDFGKGPSGT